MPPGLVLFLVTLIWGSTFVVSKHVVRVIPPVPYLLLRYVVAAVLLLLVFGRHLARERGRPHLVRDGLVLGALNALGLTFQLVGQVYTTASKSAFITSLYMPMVPLLGLVLYRQPSQRLQLFAVGIATVGLGLLTFPSDGSALNPGDLLTIVSALIYAVTILETSRRSSRHDSKTLTFAQVIATTACFSVVLLGALALRPLVGLDLTSLRQPMNVGAALGVLYMAALGTVVTFLLQNWALPRMHVTHATIIFSLEAPVATLIGLISDGAEEWPGMRGAGGGLLMLFAVALSQRGSRNRPTKPVSESST